MARPQSYRIRTAGHLSEAHLAAFNDCALRHTDGGETEITGQFDQAALHGLLRHLNDLGIHLISVNELSLQAKE